MPTCPWPGAQLVVVPPLGTPLCEVGFHSVYDEDEVLDGAEAIAGRIRKSGYDVIALNEVFAADAAEILAAELFDVYPSCTTPHSSVAGACATSIRAGRSTSTAVHRLHRVRTRLAGGVTCRMG